MRSITARTSTETGHFSLQPGFGHSIQRNDSCRACSTGNPRFTSWKLCARTWAFCSGTRCRCNLARSLLGNGLWLTFASLASLTAHPRLFQRARAFLVPLSNPLQLGLGIGLQSFNAGSLLLAIHAVALHQHLEVHARSVELRSVNTGKLAGVVD